MRLRLCDLPIESSTDLVTQSLAAFHPGEARELRYSGTCLGSGCRSSINLPKPATAVNGNERRTLRCSETAKGAVPAPQRGLEGAQRNRRTSTRHAREMRHWRCTIAAAG